MRITAALAEAANTPFTIEEVDLGEPGPDEIVVQIHGTGLCHTDIAARDGVYGLPYPLVLGHEGAGVVTAVGSDVRDLRIGDRVALSFGSCGECRLCRTGQPSYCVDFTAQNYIGSRPDGSATLHRGGEGKQEVVHGNFFSQSSFASSAIANVRNAVKVDTDLDLAIVGTLGCGFQTGAGAVIRSMGCERGSRLVVLGAGPVGLGAVMAAGIQGCDAIIAVEPLGARREVALGVGATHAIDPAAGPLDEQLREIAPDGVDYVFDTTGRPEVITAAIAAVAPKATVGLVGVPVDFGVDLPLNIVGAMQTGLTVMGIVEGDSDPQQFIPELLAHQREGRFPFDKLITTYPLSRINEAIDAQHRGEVTKIVLVPDARQD